MHDNIYIQNVINAKRVWGLSHMIYCDFVRAIEWNIRCGMEQNSKNV